MVLTQVTIKSDDVMTVPEAARRLHRPKMTLYRWIRAKKIMAVQLGGILFIPIGEIERLKADL